MRDQPPCSCNCTNPLFSRRFSRYVSRNSSVVSFRVSTASPLADPFAPVLVRASTPPFATIHFGAFCPGTISIEALCACKVWRAAPFADSPCTCLVASARVTQPCGANVALISCADNSCFPAPFAALNSANWSWPCDCAINRLARKFPSSSSKKAAANNRSVCVLACAGPDKYIVPLFREKSMRVPVTSTGFCLDCAELFAFTVFFTLTAAGRSNFSCTSRCNRSAPSSELYAAPIAWPLPFANENRTTSSVVASPLVRLNDTPRVSIFIVPGEPGFPPAAFHSSALIRIISTSPEQDMSPLSFVYRHVCVSMVSCRAPSLPKMVIFTPSRSLAFAPLKSIDLDASTVKIFRTPSPFENVRWLDCRSTSTGADGGAFLRSTCRVQPRFKYTPTVSPTKASATAALHRAYVAASLFLIAECHLPGDIAFS